ncbi:MAG: HAMP domain-containing histidine kinase [Caldilineaceae bacterium]|nr:HAMP domain-containing histidine kinase [Caldilineaceae bacterium]
MFRSIRWRLVASYTCMTLLAVTLVGVLALFLIERYLLHQERDYLALNANAVARQLEPMLQAQVAQPVLVDLARTTALFSDVQVRILDAQAQLLADSGQPFPDTVTLMLESATGAAAGVTASASREAGVWVQVYPAQAATAATAHGEQTGSTAKASLPTLPPLVLFRRGTEFRNDPGFGEGFLSTTLVTDTRVIVSSQVVTRTTAVQPIMPVQAGVAEAASTLEMVEPIAVPGGYQLSRLWQTLWGEPQRVTKAVSSGSDVMGYVELRSTPAFATSALALMQRAFLVAGVGVAFLSMLVALWMSRSLTAPLQDLIQTTEQMHSGALSARASVRTQDEIGLLATQFNTMAAQLESSFAELAAERDALRRFVADASHELRTPITALKTFGELLLGPAGEVATTRQEFLQESQKQVQRLEWMTSALLKLSRLDAGLTELKTEVVDLRELLTATTKLFLARAEEKAITLTIVTMPTPVLALCNPSYLEMALVNLLDNALKFTPTGGLVQLGAAVTTLPHKAENTVPSVAWAELWVHDDGVGIAAEELPYIFDRFYRGSLALPSKVPTTARVDPDIGSGLGLAIVQSIVKAHQGQVTVQSRRGGGSLFVLKLPLATGKSAP